MSAYQEKMSAEMKDAVKYLKQAFDLVGADGLRMAIMELASAQLTMAIQNLYTDREWVTMLYSAMREPKHSQLGLLCKLMDKMVPSPQSVKTLQDTPDQFIVNYTKPDDVPTD